MSPALFCPEIYDSFFSVSILLPSCQCNLPPVSPSFFYTPLCWPVDHSTHPFLLSFYFFHSASLFSLLKREKACVCAWGQKLGRKEGGGGEEIVFMPFDNTCLFLTDVLCWGAHPDRLWPNPFYSCRAGIYGVFFSSIPLLLLPLSPRTARARVLIACTHTHSPSAAWALRNSIRISSGSLSSRLL